MELSDLAKVFKALSNEQRLRLFYMLYDWEKEVHNTDCNDERCFGVEKAFTKACSCMDLSKSTVSHHIKELQNAGLITCERNGQMLCCKINNEIIEAVRNFTK